MRYYEIAQRPKPQTATDRIARGERHLEPDAGQISPSSRSSRMSDNPVADRRRAVRRHQRAYRSRIHARLRVL
jgi:hypothetical protein